MKNQNIEKIFRALDSSIENQESELNFNNNFELLIAVILSAQTTDVRVNLVTPKLFKAAPTPEAMIKLSFEDVLEMIKSVGLSNTKAKNLLGCCQKLVDEFGSEVPADRKKLESLPGVGAKTAGVVLNVAFKQPAIPVDTHVLRVSNRIGLVKTKTPNETEKKLLEVVPKWALIKAHHLLILHGRYICKARKPQCGECVISEYCLYQEKNN